jgi:hypothetical protein
MFGWLYSLVVGTFCRHKWNIIYQGHTKTNSGLIEKNESITCSANIAGTSRLNGLDDENDS